MIKVCDMDKKTQSMRSVNNVTDTKYQELIPLCLPSCPSAPPTHYTLRDKYRQAATYEKPKKNFWLGAPSRRPTHTNAQKWRGIDAHL